MSPSYSCLRRSPVSVLLLFLSNSYISLAQVAHSFQTLPSSPLLLSLLTLLLLLLFAVISSLSLSPISPPSTHSSSPPRADQRCPRRSYLPVTNPTSPPEAPARGGPRPPISIQISTQIGNLNHPFIACMTHTHTVQHKSSLSHDQHTEWRKRDLFTVPFISSKHLSFLYHTSRPKKSDDRRQELRLFCIDSKNIPKN